MGKRILIIGGVALGPKAAARARRRDAGAEITIVERGSVYSYAGCGMSYYIEGRIPDVDKLVCNSFGVRRDEEFFRETKDVRVLGGTEAVRINRGDKTVTVRDLASGRVYDIAYDSLVLGTGASPVVPRMEGVDLEGVYRLYCPGDAEAIRERLDAGARRVVVVGGGLIGMEVCGPFASRGCEVTVVEMMDRLVPALLDPEMAMLLENYLREKGIVLRLGGRVTRISRDSGGALAVETSAGAGLEADMVILAIGVKPNVELARGAGLELGATGAIAVNDRLQTSDPDIYAGGDCVENVNLVTGGRVYAPLGSTANRHGRVIGDNVTGGDSRFPGVVGTTAFRVLDWNVGRTGLTEREARGLGFDPVVAVAPRTDCSDYYPGCQHFTIKLVADRGSCRLLGAQVLGPGDAIKRLDVVAACLGFGGKIRDLAELDLGYAPPYATAIDAVAHAANVLRNKVQGLAHGVSAAELRARLGGGGELVLLDVRSAGEVEAQPFRDRRVVNIPLDELRGRLEELPRGREIVVFCRTGVRAYEAERVLRGAGFADVGFLDGSLAAWPYPL